MSHFFPVPTGSPVFLPVYLLLSFSHFQRCGIDSNSCVTPTTWRSTADPKAAERVKRSVSRFITGRLKLVVNEEKSAVGRLWHSKCLQEPLGARRRPKMGGGGRQHPQGCVAAQQDRNGMRGAA